MPETDPTTLAVLAAKFDAIVREMTHTLFLTGRSAALNSGRDFSCAITTSLLGEEALFASAEGLPVHIYGSNIQVQSMRDIHGDEIDNGDAFLHNDPWLGGSHAADNALIVPVLIEGELSFSVIAKAHLSDIGNAEPTSYMPRARDVYEEGALIFPCVRIQRNFQDCGDIIRMCRKRIRVADQWYGDYLAMLAAARIGQKRILEVVDRYGLSVVRAFVQDWLHYSEVRMRKAVSSLKGGEYHASSSHDPFFGMPEGLTIGSRVSVDPQAGSLLVDLTDNPDTIAGGANASEATAKSGVMQAVFSVLDEDIPHNSGSFSPVDIRLREGCVAGTPVFPTSCSLATSNPVNRIIGATQLALSGASETGGLAEAGGAQNAGFAVISGSGGASGDYVNQLCIGSNGGPASSRSDGWLTYGVTVIAGLLYRDSVEICEQKYPMHFGSIRPRVDSGGAGRHRGAPGLEVTYGPIGTEMFVTYPADGFIHGPQGAAGGLPGAVASAALVRADETVSELPNIFAGVLKDGEMIISSDCGGGGYGDPLERPVEALEHDLNAGFISAEAADSTYGAVLSDRETENSLYVIDREATIKRRRSLRDRGSVS